MTYTAHQLAQIAGISVRTLHHYDEIGLLSPARQSNGYRSYDEAELLRLQQILFFRELEYPLENIAKLLAQPDFDMTASLKRHRVQIEQKRLRLAGFLTTIDKTLAKISGEKQMKDEELFEALWDKHEKEYAAEAEERWRSTEAYKQSAERMKKLTKEDHARIIKEGDVLMAELAACIPSGPRSAEVQKLIKRHYEALRTFYEPSPQIYRGLAQMYTEDARFRAYFEKYDPRMPEFMREAMDVYCDGLEAKKNDS